jgi:hypothetical protein
MLNINALMTILKPYFKADKRRLDCIAQILVALFTVRTVNLVELAQALVSGGEFEARYKRIRRFLKEFTAFNFDNLSRLLAHLFLPQEGKWQLAMDRTNWRWGKADINILMLSVVCGGVSVPLVWSFLPSRGCSNLAERIHVLNIFLKIFGLDKIDTLLADREFVGADWFAWLTEHKIPFTIRIKQNILVESGKGKIVHAHRLFGYLNPGKAWNLKTKKIVLGTACWLSATRTPAKDWVIIVSTHEPELALSRYKNRWGIETLFGFLKSKGFNFEDTHVILADRLHNLLALLTLAFCLAYKFGSIVVKLCPVKIKKHGRPEKSIFRVGLDIIREAVFTIDRRIKNYWGKNDPFGPNDTISKLVLEGY